MSSDQRYFDDDKAKKRTSVFSSTPQQRPSSDYDYENFLPIDHGWAWVICLASFLTSYLTGLSSSAISILFLEIVDFYRTSYSVASLGMTSIVLAFSIMSVVSAYLVPLLGERYLTILAGVIYASCSVCVFFTTTIAEFIVLSAIKGAAAGSIVIPVVSMLAKFFKQRLSFAMSISSSGFCVASITAPALIRDLNNEYGFRGTYLILAGFELHMLVAGLLLRPLSWYRRRKRVMILLHIKGSTYPKTDVRLSQAKHSTHATNSEIERFKTQKELDLLPVDKKPSSTTITTATGISTFRSSQKDDKGNRASNTRALYEYPNSSTESSTDFNSISFYPMNRKSKARSETRSHELNSDIFISMIMTHGTIIMSSPGSIWGHDERRNSCGYGFRKASRGNKTRLSDGVDGSVYSGKTKSSIVSRKSKRSGTRTVSSAWATTLPETETSTLGQRITFAEEPLVKKWSFFQSPKILRISQSFGELKRRIRSSSGISQDRRECYCFRALFHSPMMTHGAFVMLLWASIPGSVNQYIVQYLPTIAELKGATKDEAALVVTICGAVDLYSRIFVGFLADKYWLRPTQIVSLAQFCLGMICHCNIFIKDFNTLMIMALTMGLFLGTRSTLLPVMIVELLGVDMMPKALAIITMTTTFTSAFHGLFLSSMIETVHSIKPVLHYVGLALMLSSLGILLTIPLILEDEDESVDSQEEYIFKPSEPRRFGSPISFRRRGSSV